MNIRVVCQNFIVIPKEVFRQFTDVFCTILCKFSHDILQFFTFFTLPKFIPK